MMLIVLKSNLLVMLFFATFFCSCRKYVFDLPAKNFYIFAPSIGALAQQARAFDWQSRGHRFDSGMLHQYN